MRQSDIQNQLQEAIQLAQAGQRSEARRLLEEIVAVDPNVTLAWMWLATVSTDREERITYLERVLSLDPTNTRAQEAYAQLTGQAFTPPTPPPGQRSPAGTPPTPPDGSPPTLMLLLVLAFVGVLVIAGLLVSGTFNGDDDPTPSPTMTRRPSATPGPSPTPTWTPLPTDTPGPSPTSIWDVPPATWTPSATRTPAPTSTPQPTRTPTLTPSITPTIPTSTPRPTRTATPDESPVPDESPTPDESPVPDDDA